MTSGRSVARRIWFATTIAVACLVAGLVAASFVAQGGETGRSIGKLEGLRDAAGNAVGVGTRFSPRDRLQAAAAVVSAIWTLVLACALLRARRARWPWWPLAILSWWVLCELLVAPFLVVPLNLWTYGIARKVDHRPTNTDGEFNRDSLRGTPDPSRFTAQGRNVLFLGDSFTFGSGVEVEQTFVRRFETEWNAAHPGRPIQTANFGWVSSSPLLSLRRLRDVGERYHPRLVVLCLDMTDFSDDLRYGNMLAARGLYALYDKLPISLKVFRDVAPSAFQRLLSWSVGSLPEERFFASLRPLDETRSLLAPTLEHVRAIDAWCREHASGFVLVVLPRCYQYDEREAPRSFERGEYPALGPHVLEPFRYFAEVAPESPFPIVSLLPAFQDRSHYPTCFEEDPHWNPAGHEVAARALVRELAPFLPP